MEGLKVGDTLTAEHYCGFPDHTTAGREYPVTQVTQLFDGRIMFRVTTDDGKDRMPVSTTFKKKVE